MMIAKHKRVLVAMADRLGWLNWADRKIVRLATGESTRADDIANHIKLGVPKPRARKSVARKKTETRERLSEDSEEGLAELQFQVGCQFSTEELEKPQPGPIFSEQPKEFVSWVEASLVSLERNRKVGIGPDLAAELGRDTRVWIASGFIGRQTRKSRRYLPALIKLWNTAIALESPTLNERE
jgi:hypothetical protein